jgi:hypothetical protein
LRALEISKCRPEDRASAFHWCRKHQNLPTSDGYNPSGSWVAKMQHDNVQACEDVTFVDDERVLGATEDLTQGANQQVACGVQALGIQEAAC